MRIAVDTNVLGYAEGLDDRWKQARASDVLAAVTAHELVMPLQVSAELHSLIRRRRRTDTAQAGDAVARWMRLFQLHPETTASVFELALTLARDHRLQIFDAIIVGAAVESGCRMLLSEDMGDGFVCCGLTIANPFAPAPQPILADALRS